MTRAILALAFMVAACGGESSPPDAAVVAPDAEVPDAEVDRCELLCACTDEYCDQTIAECMTTCMTLELSVRECRIEHCGYAQTNPSFHCPHALGDENATGVPPACIQN